MSDVPSREVLLERVLRNLSRRETPMRYFLVQRFRAFLFRMSDPTYEAFIAELIRFDPDHVNPKTKEGFIADLAKNDESGALVGMAKAALEDPALLREAKNVMVDVFTDE
jgi:hypothetical protein